MFPYPKLKVRMSRNRSLNLKALAYALWVLLVAMGCSHQVDRHPSADAGPLVRLTPDQHPDFGDDLNFTGLQRAIDASLSYLAKQPSDQSYTMGGDSYTVEHLQNSLHRLSGFFSTKPSVEQTRQFIRENYHVYQSVGRTPDREVLFTGYFEPILQGSLFKSDRFSVPLHTRPPDLISIDISLFGEAYQNHKDLIGRLETANRVVPYWSRSEIAQMTDFHQRAKPLVWIEDRVDRFFLEIQGSGRIILTQGAAMNVHYHGTNGHPYRSIGSLLIQQEKISREAMSMQAIRAYLRAHPEAVDEVLAYNPSFVFFKREEGGPYGSINVPLTPGRSIATDRRLFPKAALAFIETQKPIADTSGKIHKWLPFGRFVLNQDTGGAIKGPGRADIFWGNGPYAELAAGYLKNPGRLFFIVAQNP